MKRIRPEDGNRSPIRECCSNFWYTDTNAESTQRGSWRRLAVTGYLSFILDELRYLGKTPPAANLDRLLP